MPKNTIASPFFVLRYQKNVLSHSRLAVVVSKKVAPTSVERHKIKRLFIEYLNELYEPKPPFDLVFYLKKAALGGKEEEIKSLIGKIFKKIV